MRSPLTYSPLLDEEKYEFRRGCLELQPIDLPYVWLCAEQRTTLPWWPLHARQRADFMARKGVPPRTSFKTCMCGTKFERPHHTCVPEGEEGGLVSDACDAAAFASRRYTCPEL